VPQRRTDPWVEKLAWLLDSSIPIGRWSIGLDGLLGLVPGLGDFTGSILSGLIVLRAYRDGVSRVAIARMVANLAIDALLGTFPLVGDLFDFAFKANQMNLQIYQESLQGGRVAGHWAFLAALAAALLAIAAIPLAALWLLFRTLQG
jgi:hypothetical protein